MRTSRLYKLKLIVNGCSLRSCLPASKNQKCIWPNRYSPYLHCLFYRTLLRKEDHDRPGVLLYAVQQMLRVFRSDPNNSHRSVARHAPCRNHWGSASYGWAEYPSISASCCLNATTSFSGWLNEVKSFLFSCLKPGMWKPLLTDSLICLTNAGVSFCFWYNRTGLVQCFVAACPLGSSLAARLSSRCPVRSSVNRSLPVHLVWRSAWNGFHFPWKAGTFPGPIAERRITARRRCVAYATPLFHITPGRWHISVCIPLLLSGKGCSWKLEGSCWPHRQTRWSSVCASFIRLKKSDGRGFVPDRFTDSAVVISSAASSIPYF